MKTEKEIRIEGNKALRHCEKTFFNWWFYPSIIILCVILIIGFLISFNYIDKEIWSPILGVLLFFVPLMFMLNKIGCNSTLLDIIKKYDALLEKAKEQSK